MYGHGKGPGEERVEMEGHVGSLWGSPSMGTPGEMGWTQCRVQVLGDATGFNSSNPSCPRKRAKPS